MLNGEFSYATILLMNSKCANARRLIRKSRHRNVYGAPKHLCSGVYAQCTEDACDLVKSDPVRVLR